nr:MAG TPA: hypothetical protein [Caudoviricetes sp.]
MFTQNLKENLYFYRRIFTTAYKHVYDCCT